MAAPGKKRYQLTLTQSTVERFQDLEREMNMPQGSMSAVMDDSLLQIVKTIEKLKSRGRGANLADLFHIIGEQLDEIQEDEQKVPKAKK